MKIISLGLLFLVSSFPVFLAQSNEQALRLRQGDVFHFGIVDEKCRFDARFKVLDGENTSAGEEGLFLLLESLVSDDGKAVAFRKEKDEEHNSYAGSDAKAWCARFYEDHFSALEKEYILPTFCSDEPYSVPAAFGFGGKTPSVDFAAEENILDGDHVFLLSAKEASSERYGLIDAQSRLASYEGVTASYWLRSPHDRSNFPNDVGIVFYNGWLMDFVQHNDNVFGVSPIYMRPVLNLRKIPSEELCIIGENQYCLKGDKERFLVPNEAPSYKQRDPLPMLLAIGIASLLILIGTPIVIVIPIKRHRKKKRIRN